jgi:hypothetical protein
MLVKRVRCDVLLDTYFSRAGQDCTVPVLQPALCDWIQLSGRLRRS